MVDIEKLRDYSLNPEHGDGQHKARVFRSALGFTQADASKLRDLILDAVLTNNAALRETDEHGTRYKVDFVVEGLHGPVTIRTGWIIDAGETIPRMVSCFVRRNIDDERD